MRNTSTHKYVDISIYEQWIVGHKYGKYEKVNSTFDGRETVTEGGAKSKVALLLHERIGKVANNRATKAPIQRNISNKTVTFVLFSPRL